MIEKQTEKKNIRASIQKMGGNLAGMIMPNIGAFIAWGLITALFISTGWMPNEELATLVDPMIKYLLPILIGYTAGKMIYDARGGVVGATATMGVIVGADIPMFLGAMIMGPIGGLAIKQVDKLFKDRVKEGFEMLVNNFSAGIVGMILTILSFKLVGPVVVSFSGMLASGVETMIQWGALPLASVFVEPAKVLFLNNAINHGILSPIGIEQAASAGKSILFLIESNPGPGLGILLAVMLFGKGVAKKTAPGAAIIHFFGGIHEIYFPYILMKPVLLLAAIAGGIAGVFTFGLFNVGLVAAASPGSIFALLGMTPKGDFLGVLAGVTAATAVSFVVSAVILKASKASAEDGEGLDEATKKMEDLKGKKSSVSSQLTAISEMEEESVDYKEISLVIFACDAGMGSSAMGASILRNMFKKNDISVEVTNMAINNLPADSQIIVTNKTLLERAKAKCPHATFVAVDNFLNSPEYNKLADRLKENQEEKSA
ncbi:PTS mannitol transporter subunit IICB [Bacillus sp. 1P06AnD]|uniref:PTS mannitol transporter subunit IICB n=1 Tax=Bacillus sp. 1P06AnD TaxID=3132208 RepID=UPI0039A0C361